MITEPDIYHNIPAADYHADPCPEPSLSSTVGRILLNRSPLHAYIAHPKLNPRYKTEAADRAMNLGSVAHELLFGKGGGVQVIEADNFRTRAAQEDRDGAIAFGKVPILRKDMSTVDRMTSLALEQLDTVMPAGSFKETVIAWREGNAWCRAMIDCVSDDLRTIVDYKTTAKSARADEAARTIFNMGYHYQARFYLRGLDALDPEGAGRRQFIFLFQETDAPYACQLIRLDEAAMTIAGKMVMASIGMWQRCMERGEWPGYPSGVQLVSMPDYQQAAWLARELADPLMSGDTGEGPLPENDRKVVWTP